MQEEKNIYLSKILNIIISIVFIALIIVCGNVIIKENKKSEKESLSTGDAYLLQIKEVMDKLKKNYYGELDEKALVEGAIEGMMDSVDDIYTRYVSQNEFDEMLEGTNSTYTGLGIHINYDQETGGILVNSVMPDSPAEKQGIEPGDIFLKIDDLYCTSKTYYQCIAAMKKDEPTKLHIAYYRDEKVLEGDFTTEVVNSNTVIKNIINDNIGYLRIYSFDMGTSTEFYKYFNEIKKNNLKGMIIDLRSNPGGLVSEACSILRGICPEGILVKTVNKEGVEKVQTNNNNNKLDIPLVVLVNSNSASASEIFTGAVKDLKAGTIVGTKTYGKGIVQGVQKLKLSKGALSITTSKYYTASGIEIHKNGIEPDVVVQADEKYKNKWYIPFENDLELQKAIEIINATEK